MRVTIKISATLLILAGNMQPILSQTETPPVVADTVITIAELVVPTSAPAGVAVDSLPARWTYDEHFLPETPTDDPWWQNFNDPTLTRLIEMGLKYNYNISMAVKRIDLARNSLDMTKAGYYPTVNAQAGWSMTRNSGYTTKEHSPASNISYWNIGVTASWEVDVFGRIKERLKSAEAAIDVSRMDRAAVEVSLAAQIANAYITLRTYQEQLQVAHEHIASQKHIIGMTEARHEAGLASMLDVTQSKVVYYSTQASIPKLEASIRSTINTLTLLVGQFPDEVSLGLNTPAPLPNVFHMVGIGVPSELLRRRPDIIQAEYQLASDAASLGIAKKDFLPTLTLNGSVGVQAHSLGDMFKGDSFTYSIAPTLTWTIFDGFSRKYNRIQAEEQIQLDIDNYNYTVQQAVGEVDNAIISYAGTLQNISLLEQTVSESKKSLELSVDLYRNSLSPFSNVVDSQMNLLSYQNNLIAAQGAALQSLVALYKSLGGGWQVNK